MFHFSELVDIGTVRQIYGSQTLLYGNIDPHIKLLMETTNNVEEEVKRIINAAGKLGRLAMAPGCAMPVNVPEENFKAFVEACKSFGTYPII